MSALNDTLTYREVTHIWDENVSTWETEHMDDDDVLALRAESSRLPETVQQRLAASVERSKRILNSPFDNPYDYDEEDGFA